METLVNLRGQCFGLKTEMKSMPQKSRRDSNEGTQLEAAWRANQAGDRGTAAIQRRILSSG
jgi:hypothetical protein